MTCLSFTLGNFKIYLVMLLFFCQVPLGAQILFEDDFESGSFEEKWKTHLDGKTALVEVVSKPVRSGEYAVRMRTSKKGEDRRAELVPFIDRFKWGEEFWIGFSMYIKKNLGKAAIIHQHHSIPNNRNWKDCIAGPNSLTFKIKDDKTLQILTATDEAYINAKPPKGAASLYQEALDVPIEQGRWIDVVYHFKYMANDNGFFQCWINGALVLDDKGANVYKYDVCGKLKIEEQYLKIGLYPASTGADGELFYDEIKIGGAKSTFKDVSPKSM